MQILSQTFGPVDTNSYVLIDHPQQSAVWIDPAPGSASWIDEVLPKNYLIDKIVLTHSHWDHISDIGRSKRMNPTHVFVHPLDAENVKKNGNDGLAWPSNVLRPLPCEIHLIEEGQSWSVGNFSFQVLHTPGHSMGSCCFLNLREKILISGDTLFAFGFGRVDFPTSSPKLMRQSLYRLYQLEPYLRLLPGHGPSCEIGELDWLRDLLDEQQ